MLLHKVTDSPFHSNRLQSCLEYLGEQDAILLMQDAVYAMQHQALVKQLSPLPNKIYLLQSDASARGIEITLDKLTPIDYAEMVRLTLAYDNTISW